MPEESALPQTYRDLAGLQLPSNSPVRLPRSAQQNILGPTHQSRRKRARVGQTFELFTQLRIQNQHRFRPSHRHRHVHCAREMHIWDITVVPTCPDSPLDVAARRRTPGACSFTSSQTDTRSHQSLYSQSPVSAAHTPSTALPHILSPPTLSSFQMPGSLRPSTAARTDS